MVTIENDSYILRVKLRFYAFSSIFGTYAHKVVQTSFALHETWHTIIFGIYYEFLSVFGTFAHKVALTWFALHET